MKKTLSLILISIFISSCNFKKKEIIRFCEVTSCKKEQKVSIHDQMNPRPKYIVSTSCGNRKFTVYRKYNIGDTVKLTEVVIED